MNLSRLVIRTSAIAALNNFRGPPWPTIAGSHIYDSRIEPTESAQPDVAFPICVVYTDYDKDHWDHHSLAHRDRLLTVTFELLIAVVTQEEEGQYRVEYPLTDSELETSMDIFEAQVARALRANNPAADCWRHHMSGIVNIISRRGATVEGGQKLAARQITVESKVPRGPANGTVPLPVRTFLDRLKSYPDFAERVPAIEDMYAAEASLTEAERLLAVMGWSDMAAGMLGYQRGPVVTLGTPVTWLQPNGSPLP